jgi:uncharacterized DUF497 family protein
VRYDFEWDPEKERANVRKHGSDFRRASTVFRDPNQVTVFDDDHSTGEDRWITMGIDSGGIVRVVVHTFELVARDAIRIRIISARKAEAVEVRQYQSGART